MSDIAPRSSNPIRLARLDRTVGAAGPGIIVVATMAAGWVLLRILIDRLSVSLAPLIG